MILSCPSILCPGPEFNYSSEGEELVPPFFAVVYPNPTDGIDTPWTMAGCLYICTSYISQEDANLCALRQATLCANPPEEVWYSAAATCCVNCPDGTEYCYVVPAGMFIAKTQADAESQAQAYACQQAQDNRICFGPLPRCTCVGSHYSASITLSVDRSDLIFSLVGFLPPGLEFLSGGGAAVITGIPTVNGTHSFQIVATAPNGSYAIKTFVIQVIEVTTTALTAFTVGTPYSFQLSAAGGSGNYTWSISTGTLPDGLDLSQSGLISGTPTGGSGSGTINFEVRDATCENAERIELTPRAALTASSSTRVKTFRGFSEYTDFVGTGTLYKRVDYSGSMTQIAFPNFNFNSDDTTQCGGLEFVYSGHDQIDNLGNIISRHSKNMFVMCAASQPKLFEIDPATGITPIFNPVALYGYCWSGDPESCSVCDDDDTTWSLYRDDASFGSVDYPTHMLWDTSKLSHTATVLTYAGTSDLTGGVILDPSIQGFPKNNGNGVYAEAFPFVRLESSGGFTATLSIPYTDADAEATAVVYTGTSKTAENAPNYQITGANHFLTRHSRITTVTFHITCTRLIVGRDYIVTYDFANSDGSGTGHLVQFTADDITHVIDGVIPEPSVNLKTTVRNQRIQYA